RPRAVLAPPGLELVGELAIGLRVAKAEEVEQEQVLRDHRRVRLQLAHPPAVGMLELEQPPRARLEGAVERGHGRDSCHLKILSRAGASGAAPAARPLRTAPSIVAGQPVSVQAPARTTFGCAVCVPARAARVPGRPANVAAGSRLTRDQRSFASPSRAVSSAVIRFTRPRPRISASSGAPLETTVRYWPRSGWWPVSAPRSKTQCAGLPRRAASGGRR